MATRPSAENTSGCAIVRVLDRAATSAASFHRLSVRMRFGLYFKCCTFVFATRLTLEPVVTVAISVRPFGFIDLQWSST